MPRLITGFIIDPHFLIILTLWWLANNLLWVLFLVAYALLSDRFYFTTELSNLITTRWAVSTSF